MKATEPKLYTDLFTFDEFVKHYKGAGRRELKSALKRIGNSRDISKQNEKRAINALLM